MWVWGRQGGQEAQTGSSVSRPAMMRTSPRPWQSNHRKATLKVSYRPSWGHWTSSFLLYIVLSGKIFSLSFLTFSYFCFSHLFLFVIQHLHLSLDSPLHYRREAYVSQNYFSHLFPGQILSLRGTHMTFSKTDEENPWFSSDRADRTWADGKQDYQHYLGYFLQMSWFPGASEDSRSLQTPEWAPVDHSFRCCKQTRPWPHLSSHPDPLPLWTQARVPPTGPPKALFPL